MGSTLADLVVKLESEAGSVQGEGARALKKKVEEALSEAESVAASDKLINRLDQLLISLTEASRENVCTNSKCPYYSKKCKMR